MSVDHIRYDLLVRDALRGVVRRVVSDVAKNGLPGDHHLYISFDTRAPGVKISPRLRGQYPEEMTIVLQHQFWDLAATDTGIEVGLSFSGIPERLIVPYEALKGFFDPSVQFGLEFEVTEEGADGGPSEAAPSLTAATESPAPQENVPSLPRPARQRSPRKGRAAEDADKPQGETAAEPPGDDEPPRPDGGAEVVSLDRFRKK